MATIYNKETGEIVLNISYSDEAVRMMLNDNQDFLREDISGSLYKIVNGKPERKQPPPINVYRYAQEIRLLKLMESDWTQLPDNDLDDDKKNEWKEYRQELRDFPVLVLGDSNAKTEQKIIDLLPVEPD
ncbi:MAG: hypothetical protein CMC89_05135 [Flavobacteriaceae bacterium]|nr:hypothetical protein [Flavobacteriaceae bacterium]|tara:strand:- start:5848 stop:6234 length:387 start_codon:yes stop_codon:yes gene_type:complete